jgi:glycosyltransferase involved in cell wall biosynthesis
MINNRLLKIIGPLMINNRYVGKYLELILSPLLIFSKWFFSNDFTVLSPQIQNLARRAEKNAGSESENKRNIVFVNRNFMQGQVGGVNFLIALMAFGLKRRGHRVRILCESPRPWPKRTSFQGVEIVGIRPRLFFIDHSSPPFYAGWSTAVKMYLRNETKGDEVINVFATIAGLETVGTEGLSNKVNSICYLVTDHIIHKFGTITKPDKGSRVAKFIKSEREFLMSPSIRIIGDSKAIVDDLSKVLSLPELPKRSGILYIGWPKNDEKTNVDLPVGKLVTCIGSVSFRKGTRTLVEAWLSICADPMLANVNLLICGPTSDDHESETLILNAPVSSRITRIKVMSEAEKNYILSKTDVVVIPSNYESFGIVCVEAMQMGCQIVASQVGGLPEVLAGVGKFFETGNSMSLAATLKGVLTGQNTTPIQTISNRADDFNFELMLQNLEAELR